MLNTVTCSDDEVWKAVVSLKKIAEIMRRHNGLLAHSNFLIKAEPQRIDTGSSASMTHMLPNAVCVDFLLLGEEYGALRYDGVRLSALRLFSVGVMLNGSYVVISPSPTALTNNWTFFNESEFSELVTKMLALLNEYGKPIRKTKPKLKLRLRKFFRKFW